MGVGKSAFCVYFQTYSQLLLKYFLEEGKSSLSCPEGVEEKRKERDREERGDPVPIPHIPGCWSTQKHKGVPHSSDSPPRQEEGAKTPGSVCLGQRKPPEQ